MAKKQAEVEEVVAGDDVKSIARAIAVAQKHPDPDHFVACVTAAYEGKEQPLAAGEEQSEEVPEEASAEAQPE